MTRKPYQLGYYSGTVIIDLRYLEFRIGFACGIADENEPRELITGRSESEL